MKTILGILGFLSAMTLMTVIGLLVALSVTGKLNAKSAAAIVAALRGEDLVPATQATTQPATQPTSQPAEEGLDFRGAEERQAVLDRKLRLIDDRQNRLMDAELKLIHDREDLTDQQDAFKKQRLIQEKANQDEGFKTALDMYMKMPAKQVKEDFMKLDIDVVVRYLMHMPTRTQTKILGEFKTPEEQDRRRILTERIRTQEILLGQDAASSDNESGQPSRP
jgi:flagellar motility protein MotE (MotC chaperone)